MVEEMPFVVVCCTGIGKDATWLVNFADCIVNTGDFDAKMDDDWFCDDGGEVTDDDGKTDILLELDMETPELDMETPELDMETPKLDMETPELDMETPELDMETLELDMESAAQTEKRIKNKYIKYHSMQIFPPFHWPRAHCVTCK